VDIAEVGGQARKARNATIPSSSRDVQRLVTILNELAAQGALPAF
jgi:hypothetical protein